MDGGRQWVREDGRVCLCVGVWVFAVGGGAGGDHRLSQIATARISPQYSPNIYYLSFPDGCDLENCVWCEISIAKSRLPRRRPYIVRF